MEPQLRVGILGAAKIAPRALIDPARRRSDVVVRCVAARDRARAEAFAAQHGLTAEASYESLIGRDDLDLIYVALPPAAHCEWSTRALEAGKAVLCEKPFARTTLEARAMVKTSRVCGRPLIEAFHYRHHEAMHRAVAIVRSGTLGTIRTARAVFGTLIAPSAGELRWSADLGGGAVMDLGCYPIHALRTLMGAEPTIISATATYEHGVEAEASAELLFPGGAFARVWCSMTSPTLQWDLELTGERGRLALSNYIAPQFGSTLLAEIDGTAHREVIEGPTTYEAQLAHIVDVLARDASPLTGGNDAIANMSVIDAIRGLAARDTVRHR